MSNLEIGDLWHDLRAVISEIRPDWDLSTRGLREAWNAGDSSHFYGWNKHAGMEDAAIARKKEYSRKLGLGFTMADGNLG